MSWNWKTRCQSTTTTTLLPFFHREGDGESARGRNTKTKTRKRVKSESVGWGKWQKSSFGFRQFLSFPPFPLFCTADKRYACCVNEPSILSWDIKIAPTATFSTHRPDRYVTLRVLLCLLAPCSRACLSRMFKCWLILGSFCRHSIMQNGNLLCLVAQNVKQLARSKNLYLNRI